MPKKKFLAWSPDLCVDAEDAHEVEDYWPCWAASAFAEKLNVDDPIIGEIEVFVDGERFVVTAEYEIAYHAYKPMTEATG